MHNRKQAGKLKLIRWLMLASEILLLLFLCTWIVNQYKEAETRLSKDVATIFTKVENKIADSLLNNEITILLQDNPVGSDTLQFKIAARDTGLIAGQAGHKALNLSTDPSFVAHATTKRDRVTSVHTYRIAKNAKPLPDNPEDTRKVLRLALQQIVNDIDLDTLRTKTDTSLLRKTFTTAVQQHWPNIGVHWHAAGPNSSSFSYKPKEVSPSLNLTGYQLYIVKAIASQTAFGLVLLLLTSLAFILAYRNAKQQTLFSQQKDHFISNISHELKTPVATTKVAIEALSMYDALEDPQRSKRYLRMAGWEINRLELMISKIMDTMQAANGVLTLAQKPLMLPALVLEITHSLQQVFIEQAIQLQWDIEEESLWVMADHTHLTGALYNLIDNAIKYGNNLIKISIQRQDGRVCFTIADNGPGIPSAYQSRVFEQFVRIPQGDIHNVKGYGLGLSYAQYVVAAHKGSLKLKQVPGWGAVFCISLPELHENEL
ncbi:sensor histidine kinase KdpD [Taibaiella sp. KBW10]|uniref:sensor histidine kinase n=1 Tax=Taibaiella sp. KBW10 TaxID=2153357 RepID=UPI000F595587|nr:HAMP domain-containing sensor histidine kinase [Taibaiella sp. KBW10]